MKPYRTSLSARILSLAASYLLVGGGVAALAGAEPALALSALLLPAVAASVVGLGVGIEEHPWPTTLLVIFLPFALFLFATALQLALETAPALGGALVAAGVVPLAATLIAPSTVARRASPVAASSGA